MQNLVMITLPHFPPQIGENANPIFLSLPFPFLLYSCSSAQPKRLDRFLRSMAQNTWFGARKCLSYDRTITDQLQGVISPKNYPKTPPDAEIPAKISIS